MEKKNITAIRSLNCKQTSELFNFTRVKSLLDRINKKQPSHIHMIRLMLPCKQAYKMPNDNNNNNNRKNASVKLHLVLPYTGPTPDLTFGMKDSGKKRLGLREMFQQRRLKNISKKGCSTHGCFRK